MAEQLKIQITLDDGSIKQGFVNIEKQSKSSAGNMEASFTGAAKKIGGALAAVFAAREIVQFFKKSADAAMEAEQATNAFASSLAQIGKFSQQSVKDFENYASSLQKTTGVSDDLIIQNASLLTSLGNLSGEGLKKGTKAALDLAVALQIDVGTAFGLVAKAASGNVAMLSRYGIKVSEAGTASQKFANVLGLIQTRFGGLAETRLNTLEGTLTNLSNSFGEIQESIGKFLTSSPALRAFINTIADAFMSLSASIDSIRGESGDVFKPMLLSAIQLAGVINEYLIKPLELGFNLIKVGVLSVKLALDGIVVVLMGFATLLVESLVFPLRDLVVGLSSVISTVDNELAGKLKASALNIASSITQPLQNEFLNSKLIMADTFNELSAMTETTFVSKMGGSIDEFLAKLQTSVEASKASTKELTNSLAPLSEWGQKLGDLSAQIRKAIDETIVKGIVGGVAKIGANLANGVGAFDDFGKTVLGILGDFAIQMGGLLIAMGIGIDNIKVALATWNAAGLIAAGVALVLIGGALKAMSSGPAGAAASGGGIASSPSSSTELTPAESLTRQQPGTSVSLTVQGNILDSDESGSRIVALINSAFDKKGVVINQGVMA